jgi:hypothetical protein
MTPKYAYNKALLLGGTNHLRSTACKSAKYAYQYAWNIDKKPLDQTRKAACKDSAYAYWYALYVDKQPHDKTRIAVCKSPYYAYCYASYIDQLFHPKTFQAVLNNPSICLLYCLTLTGGWLPPAITEQQIDEIISGYPAILNFTLEIEP